MRIARWIMRPNRGWELQEAPVMLPPARFAAGARAAAAGASGALPACQTFDAPERDNLSVVTARYLYRSCRSRS